MNDTPVCKAIAIATSSPFGMGNSYFRIGADHEMCVDTVPFGCFKRDIFDKIGLLMKNWYAIKMTNSTDAS